MVKNHSRKKNHLHHSPSAHRKSKRGKARGVSQKGRGVDMGGSPTVWNTRKKKILFEQKKARIAKKKKKKQDCTG